MMLTTPAGMSLVASASANTTAVRGSFSDATSMTALPATRGGSRTETRPNERGFVGREDTNDTRGFGRREIEVRAADGVARRKQRVVLIAPSRIPDRAIDCRRHLLRVVQELDEFRTARFEHLGQTIQNQAARSRRRRPPLCLSRARRHDGIANVFARSARDVGAELFTVP